MWQIKGVISPFSQGLWISNLAWWWLRMKGPHPQSHVTHRSSGHVTNQKYFVFTFTRCKAHKLSRVVTRMRRPHPTCHVTPRSRCHPETVQLVVYICSTSSWSSLLKTNRFEMTMITLKAWSLHKESFYGDILLCSWVFIWKKYSDSGAGSVSGIIFFVPI